MARARRLCKVPSPSGGSHLAEPGKGYCIEHQREVDAARGRPRDRGYGWSHQKLRAQWAPRVAAGGVSCARCHRPIEAGTPWQLGHTDDRKGYTGPEHSSCNLSAAGRAAHGLPWVDGQS